MKAGWELKTLGDVLKLEYGKPLPKTERVSDGKFAVYGANGIKDFSNKAYVKGPSIIVGRKGSAGELKYVADDFWPLDVTYFTKHDPNIIDLKFLMLALEMAELPSLARGVKPGINRNDVYALKIPLPPLDEQKRIVSILDEAFEGLDRARENAKANLESARELFDTTLESAFDPNGKTKWEVKALGSVCEIAPKKALVKKMLTDEQLVSFVPMDHLGELKSHFTAKEDRPLSSVYKGYTYFCDDDVIIAKITPCFENGKMGLASGMTNGVGFGSSEFVPIRGQGKTLPKYLFYFLLRNNFRENGARVMSGAVGHKRVPKEYIENLPIPLPALDEQKRIAFRLDKASRQHNSLKEKYTSKLQDIADLRQSLLQKAYQGELT